MTRLQKLIGLAMAGAGLWWLSKQSTAAPVPLLSPPASGTTNTPAATAATVAGRKALYIPKANQIAAAVGLDPNLFRALIEWESAHTWSPTIVSPAGAIGLTQLMPLTALGLGVLNPMDPVANMTGGAKYLRQQLVKFGAVDKALAAYNAGPGNVSKAIAYAKAHGQTWQMAMRQYQSAANFAQTQTYVKSIMALIGKV